MSQAQPTNPKFDIRNTGRVALVTGASSGIGAAIAIELAAAGFSNLVLVARNEEKLAIAKSSCEANGAKKVSILSRDLAKPREVCKEIIDSVVEEFDRLDMIVNNAGVGDVSMARDIEEDKIDMLMSLHVKTPMLLTKYGLPHLEKTKGNIVFISSICGPEIQPQGSCLYS